MSTCEAAARKYALVYTFDLYSIKSLFDRYINIARASKIGFVESPLVIYSTSEKLTENTPEGTPFMPSRAERSRLVHYVNERERHLPLSEWILAVSEMGVPTSSKNYLFVDMVHSSWRVLAQWLEEGGALCFVRPSERTFSVTSPSLFLLCPAVGNNICVVVSRNEGLRFLTTK